ncbi:sugar ABC transporter substrate-binding protein [Muricomes intestini]|uniref:ABC transporter substrate-binding protein n=1 Tax=Muricomes intestini TaxID=1796634 RepID=UPI002FE2F5BC
MKKKTLSVIMMTVMATILLIGCGPGKEDLGKSKEDNNDAKEIKVASVNNEAMVIMEELSKKYTEETGTKVTFTILSENEIRSKITQDVGLGGGEYDLVTLGTSDMGTYLDNSWTEALEPMFNKLSDEEKEKYDLDDIFKSVKTSCSSEKNGLAALPFYSESTMICYNKEIFEQKGLTMPENPTWDDIYDLAVKCDDKGKGVAGIAIRGLAGYGENQYIFGSIMNAFGGQYYDMDWNATYDTPEVREAWGFYKKLLEVAEDGPTTCGYTECLNLFAQGKAAIYYDATVSAGTFAKDDSAVKGKVGYAPAPTAKKENTGTIGGWGIGITAASKNKDAAFDFLRWATSKEYVKLVQEEKGFQSTPSGTRISTYENQEYLEACDFAATTRIAIETADALHPAIGDTPYTGNSLPNLPEYSSWGETIASELASYISGQKNLDACISTCQDVIDSAAEEGGYRD